MVAIKHVTFSERNKVAELHPELSSQFPELAVPYLVEATDYPGDFPYVFYVLEGGVVATYISCFFDTLQRDGQQYAWAWNANLFTHPDFRGRGLAQQIVAYQLAELAKRGIVWGGVFSSPAALRLYEKLDFTIVGFASRMCLLRRPLPFLTHHMGNNLAARVASQTYQAIYRFKGLLKFGQRAFRNTYSVEQATIGELNALLGARPLHRETRAHWRDDADILRAKMAVRGSDKIALVRDTAGQPLLFFIWRVRETSERPIKEKYSGVRMFSVMEFGYFAEIVPHDALIRAAITLFNEADADLLEFVTSPQPLEASARRHGFIALGSGMSFTFKAPAGHPLEQVQDTTADWHLTHYSGDGYSFE